MCACNWWSVEYILHVYLCIVFKVSPPCPSACVTFRVELPLTREVITDRRKRGQVQVRKTSTAWPAKVGGRMEKQVLFCVELGPQPCLPRFVAASHSLPNCFSPKQLTFTPAR